MTIELTPELEAAVAAEAKRLGTTPEDMMLSALRAQFPALFLPPPADDWHARLRAVAVNAGVSLSDEDLSRESLYGDHL